jgi:hypothetical protein
VAHTVAKPVYPMNGENVVSQVVSLERVSLLCLKETKLSAGLVSAKDQRGGRCVGGRGLQSRRWLLIGRTTVPCNSLVCFSLAF